MGHFPLVMGHRWGICPTFDGTQNQNSVARRRTQRAMPVGYKSAGKDPKNIKPFFQDLSSYSLYFGHYIFVIIVSFPLLLFLLVLMQLRLKQIT